MVRRPAFPEFTEADLRQLAGSKSFCKHWVAVGLALLAAGEDLPLVAEATRARKTAFDSWLESLSKDELLAELRARGKLRPAARPDHRRVRGEPDGSPARSNGCG
jgi:hypothetical protein